MKTWIAASLLSGAVLLGGFPLQSLMAENDNPPPVDPAVFEMMDRTRTIMHASTINSEVVENGVRVNVTGADEEVVKAIQTELGNSETLGQPYPNTTVTATELENGVALTFSSGDTATAQWLQNRGEQLAYGLLRDKMHALMATQGHGPGMMSGGQGAGWMHRGGQGYGPGRMGGGQGAGWMHRGGQGYGPGRMGGGQGAGWMHGQGQPGQTGTEEPVSTD